MAADRCPNCGTERPWNAPKGLCPRCLLGQGLDSDALSLAPDGAPGATMTLAGGPNAARVLSSLTESLSAVPRILLRDTDPGTEPGPVVQPSSPEMPAHTDPAGRLQILGEIAHGGMGAVLKGRDGDLGRDLAVKVLLEQHRDNPELVRRFIEEAQIAGQLQHPGVVPIYELGAFVDRRPYFTMKLVKGRTLADVLAARTNLDVDQSPLLGVFLQICQTVAYAHARGVIHRDLKPSNVMVGGFGEVQVMDWGLAKVLPRGGASADAAAGDADVRGTIIATARDGSDSDLSHACSVLGTPAYMAPEQARGEIDQVDERADVFALGSILCEILSGRPAFTGRGSGEIQRKAARGDLADAFARLDASGADVDLLALARACLAPERDDRPRDAGGVASGLSAHMAGVRERLRAAELATAAESARAEEAQHTAAAAELARAAESARAEEAHARAAVERSRRRRTMALAASLLTMITLGGSTLAYIAQERQARAAAVERRLLQAATLLDQAHARPDDPLRWQTALAAVQQVEDDPAGMTHEVRDRLARLKTDATSGLRDAERDATLRQDLVEIRANLQDAGPDATEAAYAAAFRAAGLDVDALSTAEAADRLKRRPAAVVVELASYLDHWSSLRRAAQRPAAAWRKPLELARAADADDYRDQLRALLARDDLKAQSARLEALAGEPRADLLPAPTAVLLGAALANAGRRDAAVGLLRRAVARHPDDVWVNYGLGYGLSLLTPSAREEVVRYYTAARALRPETAHELAHQLDAMGRGDEAEGTFRDLVGRRPDPARHLACFGRFLKDHGRTEEASRILDRAVAAAHAELKLKPDDARAHNNLGNALRNQGKPTQAETEYRAALKLKPDDAEAHNSLGNALRDQGKPAEAETELRIALKLKPDDAVAHLNLGNVLWDQGKPAEVETEFRAAIKLKPDYAKAHVGLGIALADQGKPAEAETEYRAALKFKPDLAEAHNSLGNALRKQGKPVEAEAEFRAALKLKPDSAEIHSNLGPALVDQGKSAEAEAEFRAAIKLKPDYAEAHYNLGTLLQTQSKPAEAETEFRAALKLKLKPDFAAAHSNLGAALMAQGKPAEAETEYRAALKLKPDYAEAHCNLGLLLREAGRNAEALRELRRGHELGSWRPDWRYPSAQWVAETERLAALDARLPAVLKGDDHPANAAERLTFAELCYNRQLHAAAARFYAEALQADPKLAHDRQAGHPYNAACAAALAGRGQGKDDPPPDEPARAQLRGQARGWLNDELAAWSQIVAQGKPGGRALVRKTLEHWKADSDLAGVRDQAELAKLPDPERQAWQTLWNHVDTLLKQAQDDHP